MSEVFIRGKGPVPQVHDGGKLRFSKGVPAHFQGNPPGPRTVMVPISQPHVMGAKHAVQAPAHTNTPSAKPAPVRVIGRPGVTPQSGVKPGAMSGQPRKPGAPVATPTKPATKTVAPPMPPPTIETQLISPEGAFLIGQLFEMFISGEQYNGRGDTPLVKLAIKTLIDLHPLLPPGVVIPIPNVEPAVVQASVVFQDRSASAPDVAPDVAPAAPKPTLPELAPEDRPVRA